MSAHFEEMYQAFYIKEHTSLSGRSDIMNYVPTRDEYRYSGTPLIKRNWFVTIALHLRIANPQIQWRKDGERFLRISDFMEYPVRTLRAGYRDYGAVILYE